MYSDREVLALVSSIYDASLEPRLWSDFLSRLCTTMGATGALLVRHGKLHPYGQVVATAQVDLSYQHAYMEQFSHRNVWLAKVRQPVQDRACTSEMLLPVSELVKTDFYHQFLQPQNVLHTVTGCIQADRYSMPICVVLRSRREGPFDIPHINLLSTLSPHMRRTLQLQDRTAGLQAQSDASLAALDALPMGCLMVDRRLRVLLANRTAQRILEANDGLTAAAGRLAAYRSHQQDRLRGLIEGAAPNGRGKVVESGGAMRLERPSGRDPLHVLVMPHRGGLDWFGPRAAAIVFISDPERKARPDQEVLASVFGLTPGESRVAGALIRGLSIEECASELAISRHTARNHLKAIFSKTDTTRQGELVERLLSSVTRLETGR